MDVNRFLKKNYAETFTPSAAIFHSAKGRRCRNERWDSTLFEKK
jgi:hypothetical protein